MPQILPENQRLRAADKRPNHTVAAGDEPEASRDAASNPLARPEGGRTHAVGARETDRRQNPAYRDTTRSSEPHLRRATKEKTFLLSITHTHGRGASGARGAYPLT